MVTIAIPSFNQGRFLDEALASIFGQDLPVEVFVLDGGSTDCFLEIIHKWKSKLARNSATRPKTRAIKPQIGFLKATFDLTATSSKGKKAMPSTCY